ncbi:nicotinate-nucleotide diphosphorylase (carboxylating), partial [Mycolicibacter hiberniae]|nr:nicotinate-nucleotide diphosphorylase (carboxylating) [Mycolicibacter hiberniae]
MLTGNLTETELAEARSVIERALAEDLCYGPDITSQATVPADAECTASMVTRSGGVIAGVDIALIVLDQVVGAGNYRVENRLTDGARVGTGTSLLTVTAPTRALLTAERTMLNLVCHLSGIA